MDVGVVGVLFSVAAIATDDTNPLNVRMFAASARSDRSAAFGCKLYVTAAAAAAAMSLVASGNMTQVSVLRFFSNFNKKLSR